MRILKCKKWLCVFAGLVVLLVGSVSVFASSSVVQDQKNYYQGREKVIAFMKQEYGMDEQTFKSVFKYSAYCPIDSTYGCIYFSEAPFSSSWSADGKDIPIYNRNKKMIQGYSNSSRFNYYTEKTNTANTYWKNDGNNVAAFGYANFDLKFSDVKSTVLKADTTGFFPAPPIAEKAGELPKMVAEKVKVILLVAVSCLALWIFSTVLLKRLPIFLH